MPWIKKQSCFQGAFYRRHLTAPKHLVYAESHQLHANRGATTAQENLVGQLVSSGEQKSVSLGGLKTDADKTMQNEMRWSASGFSLLNWNLMGIPC